MEVSRNLARKVHFIFDQLIPPIIRDTKWFMWLPFKLVYKSKSHIFMNFKSKAFDMTNYEFADTYKEISSVLFERDSDSTERTLDIIVDKIVGTTVLEVGCGNCYLADKIAER